MAQPTLEVLNALGVQKTVNTINLNGRAAAADSQPIVTATEDKSVLDAISSSLTSIDTKMTGVITGTLSAGISKQAGAINVTAASTGVIYGCKISTNADTTKVDISAGYYQIIDRSTAPLAPTVTYVTFAGVTGLVDSYRTSASATTFMLNAAGAVVQQDTSPTEADFTTYAVVGKSIHTNKTVITAVVQFQEQVSGSDQKAACFARFIGVLAKDSLITANGANLYINRSAGMMHRIGANYAASYTMPDVVATSSLAQVPVFYRYRDGAGGFKVNASVATINPNIYDNGTGTLAAPGAGNFTNQFVYVFTNGNTFVVPGQVVYGTLALALSGAATENPIVDPHFVDANLRTVISLRQNTTALNNATTTRFTQGGLFGVGNGFAGGGSATIPGDGVYSIQYNNNGVFDGVSITGLVKGQGVSAAPIAATAGAGGDYVAPGAVTASGLTMATAKMLGRATASTGAIEEIAVTGSGSAVLANTPTLITPVIGAATGTSLALTNAAIGVDATYNHLSISGTPGAGAGYYHSIDVTTTSTRANDRFISLVGGTANRYFTITTLGAIAASVEGTGGTALTLARQGSSQGGLVIGAASATEGMYTSDLFAFNVRSTFDNSTSRSAMGRWKLTDSASAADSIFFDCWVGSLATPSNQRYLIQKDGMVQARSQQWWGYTTAGMTGVSAADCGKIVYDSTLQKFRYSANGSAYADLVGSGSGGPGTGTTNVIPKWATTTTLGDSPVTVVTYGISIAGTASYTTALAAAGDGEIRAAGGYVRVGSTTQEKCGFKIDCGGTTNNQAAINYSIVAGLAITGTGETGGYNMMSFFDGITGVNNQIFSISANSVFVVQGPTLPADGGAAEVSVGAGAIAVAKYLSVGGLVTGSAPAVSATDTGKIFYDKTLQKWRYSANGSAWADLVGGSGSVDASALTGTTLASGVTASSLTSLGTIAALTATTVNKVTITAPATSATLTIPNGVTLTGPAASGTTMTLGNNETVTGTKTFGYTKLQIAGASTGALTLIAPVDAGSYTASFPAESITVAGIATAQTLTNKRVTKRVTPITTSATPTINTDNCDVVDITALDTAITNMSTNLTGTPVNKDTLIFEIKSDASPHAITWGTAFVAGGVALPTTTVANKITTVGFMYSSANSLNKWRCIASAQEA